jgi:hypothetical protein
MSNSSATTTRAGLSPDVLSVVLALSLALLVKLNLLPGIKW